MPSNPFAAQIAKEEKQFSDTFSKAVTKAVTAKDVQKKADALTKKCGTQPERQVAKVFEDAANAALKKLNPAKLGLQAVLKLNYKMNGAYWQTTAQVDVKYIMVPAGGKIHRVKTGDTLWSISETYYGSGGYWPLIAKENTAAVKSKGNFILANVDLKLPKIDIVKGVSVPPSVKKSVKPTPDSSKKAVTVSMPTLKYDLSKSKTVNRVLKMPGMTVHMKITLTGTLYASKKGVLPGSFNVKTFDADVKKSAGPFVASLKINEFSAKSVSFSSNVANTTWKSAITISKDGRVKTSLSSQSVKFTSGDYIYEGNVGINLECQFIPDNSLVTEGVSIGETVTLFIAENQTLIIGTICVAVLIGLWAFPPTGLAALAASIATLEVDMVAFAAALQFAKPAMQALK